MHHTENQDAHSKAMYKHLRTNRVYCLLMRARDKHTGEEMVVFQSVKSGRVWIRPSIEFFDGRYLDLSAANAAQPVSVSQRRAEPESNWKEGSPQYARS